jgi:hypothetical protein
MLISTLETMDYLYINVIYNIFYENWYLFYLTNGEDTAVKVLHTSK